MHPDRPREERRLLARAIVAPEQGCPSIEVGGSEDRMLRRTPLVADAFPATVCEMAYDGVSEARVGETKLASRPTDPSRILVIGDTGCRLTHFSRQLCGSHTHWPFARIARTIAGKPKPDLIVHVGDYHYREKPCPDGLSACADSPHGDGWATWRADFFEPARPLLALAPWVLVRGNHENCGRAGLGWQHLLAPEVQKTPPKSCRDDTDPYALRLADDLFLWVMDTAAAGESFQPFERAETYKKQIGRVRAQAEALWQGPEQDEGLGQEQAAATHWLALHQPLWLDPGYSHWMDFENGPACKADLQTPNKEKCHYAWTGDGGQWTDEPLAVLRAEVTSGNIRPEFILSGDTHMFQLLQPAGNGKHPWQLVAGMSGTELESSEDYAHLRPSRNVRSFGTDMIVTGRVEFGYVMLVKEDAQWTAEFYDVQGRRLLTCPITPGTGTNVAACHHR